MSGHSVVSVNEVVGNNDGITVDSGRCSNGKVGSTTASGCTAAYDINAISG